jgi:hypothetical protein
MKDKTYLEGLAGIAHADVDDSVFDADEWSLLDWSMMLDTYPHLDELVGMAKRAGVDGREAFFALSGHEVTGEGPVAEGWKSVISSPAWARARETARTRFDKAAMLEKLLKDMGTRAYNDDPTDDYDDPTDAIDPLMVDEDQDIDLDDLVGQMASESTVMGIPTDEEIEDADAMTVLVKLMAEQAGGEDKTPADALDQAMMLASQLDFGVFKDLFGKTARVVRGASRKAETARGEMVGYKSDTWSDKVVATDMLAVANGDIEAMARLAEGQLKTRKYEGEEAQGKGPVVILRDETGSMRTEQHAPALSLEVAMADAFNKDGRDLVTIAWATASTGTRQYTWGEDEVIYTRHGQKTSSYAGVQEHLRGFLNGMDTLLETGLMQALDVVDEYVPGADILIITDGWLSDSDRLANSLALGAKLERFREEQGRIWVIVLGEIDEEEWREQLPIADGFVGMGSVQSGNALEEMIASMADRSDPSSMSRRFVA